MARHLKGWLIGAGALCLTGCAGTPALPPAIPDREVIFEGLDIAGVRLGVPLAAPKDRLETSGFLSPPMLPKWREQKQQHQRLSRPKAPRDQSTEAREEALLRRVSLPAPSPGETEGDPLLTPKRRKPPREESVAAILQAADKESLVRLTRDAYFGGSAIARYAYQPGKVYQLFVSVNSPSLVTLPRGERLAEAPIITIVDKQWVVGAIQGGQGERYQQTISVSPSQAGLTARMVLATTSGRFYSVLMRSIEGAGQVGITWELSQEARDADEEAAEQEGMPIPVKHKARTDPAGREGTAPPPAPRVAVTRIHTAWEIRVEKGAPAWIPLSIWDDGSKVIIGFKSSLGYAMAPGVFGIDKHGRLMQVESTPWEDGDPRHPSYYVISGLYPQLILKDGGGNEVRLTRLDGQTAPYRVAGPPSALR